MRNATLLALNNPLSYHVIGQLHTTIKVGSDVAEELRLQALKAKIAKEHIKDLADRIRLTFSLLRDLSDLLESVEADYKDEKLPVLQRLIEENAHCGKVFNSIQTKIGSLVLKRHNRDTMLSKIQRMQAEVDYRKDHLQFRLMVFSVTIQCQNNQKYGGEAPVKLRLNS